MNVPHHYQCERCGGMGLDMDSDGNQTDAHCRDCEGAGILGLRRVSHDEFFASLKADPRDIMPTIAGKNANGYVSHWRDKNGRMFGLTVPESRYTAGCRYFLCDTKKEDTR